MKAGNYFLLECTLCGLWICQKTTDDQFFACLNFEWHCLYQSTLFFSCIGEQKFGRTDASSPVPTSLNQTVTLPQGHMQQQGFINATTMPPYYGGLAFYHGAGMMAGGFPAYTTPMYQVCSCKSCFAAFKLIICAWYQYCFTKLATLSDELIFACNLQAPVV